MDEAAAGQPMPTAHAEVGAVLTALRNTNRALCTLDGAYTAHMWEFVRDPRASMFVP